MKAVLGGYAVHLGPQKGHVADLGSHFVAKRATKNQHKRPEAEILSECLFSDIFLFFLSMGLPCRGSYEAIFGARQVIPGGSGAILTSLLVFGKAILRGYGVQTNVSLIS